MMTDPLLLTIPHDISERAQKIADSTHQPVEQVLLEHLKTLFPPQPTLPLDEQAELDALHHLSNDALWTIARKQLPADIQARAQDLMAKKDNLNPAESDELIVLVERADRLMLRKAEAASILRGRGYAFTQRDFNPNL